MFKASSSAQNLLSSLFKPSTTSADGLAFPYRPAANSQTVDCDLRISTAICACVKPTFIRRLIVC